ncbi:MAG TPA: antitoxin VapB family protein [Candidatus Acidoferrales bacterium]|nr:antitoxin VapB family protein [Candidatus Acidoferrales bacterium]
MATKNLAIREAVYRKLAEEKREGESFSDVIERVLEKRGSLLPLWGALAESRNLAEIEDDISRIRKRAKVRS